jgi:nitrogen-specific signal transduction histidine kinase
VIDTGKGIDTVIKLKFLIDISKFNCKKSGTGLGLAISKNLLKLKRNYWS